MNATVVMDYLRELCRDLDEKRPLKPFARVCRTLTPLALPAALTLGLSGCPSQAVNLYAGPPMTEICDDGRDNDNDNLTDCSDQDCLQHISCVAAPTIAAPMPTPDPPVPPVQQPPGVEICTDGLDNDQDGQTDCADQDCDSDSGCVEVYGSPFL